MWYIAYQSCSEATEPCATTGWHRVQELQQRVHARREVEHDIGQHGARLDDKLRLLAPLWLHAVAVECTSRTL